MQTILLQFLILFTNILFFTVNVHAADWKYLGYANLKSGDTFYIFVNEAESNKGGNSKLIQEKHVFNNQQILGEKSLYLTVIIERELNCFQKTLTDLKATILDSNGKKVQTFVKGNENNTEKIKASNDVNYSVFREFCSSIQ